MKGENPRSGLTGLSVASTAFVFLETLVILVGEVAQAILAIRG